MRGNLDPSPPRQLGLRSIPARAGEPHFAQRTPDRLWVYPRACGGTRAAVKFSAFCTGLSPRVRGNLRTRYDGDMWDRSIPARAGEPTCAHQGFRRASVYPRACGGTGNARAVEALESGLSPRVRGNPLMSLNVWFVSRRDSFRGYVKDCFRRAVMRRLPVPDRDG